MTDKTRAILGLVLMLVGLFYNKISEIIVLPEPEPVTPIIEIEKPTEEVIAVTNPVANLVTDQDDRLNLCVFNKIFAERVVGYLDIKAQQVNNLYVQAARNHFGTTLQAKYDGLSVGLTNLLKRGVGSQQHILSPEERDELHETFLGLAWCLNN